MRRGVRWSLFGSSLIVLATLSGCARMWFAEREPWRRDAEIACLQSGAVKEGPSVTIVSAIDGPGTCGADYPLRVGALGEPEVSGFVQEVPRPPGAVQGAPPQPLAAPNYSPNYSPARYPAPASSTGTGSVPLSLAPPLPPAAAPPVVVPLGRPASALLTAAPATLTPTATLACPVVSVLNRFVSEHVQPAAVRWFGQPVMEIKQISAYSCRGMNGNPRASISEHAFGNALDIAAFTLADGHRITVKDGWHGSPEEQGFLHDVQGAACEMFTTILAPGSNAYHYDHIHVDLMRHASGRVICEPDAIPGEVAAARAGGRYARPGGLGVTGAIGKPRAQAGRL